MNVWYNGPVEERKKKERLERKFQVVNAWYNGPVTGRIGCFSFAMFGMLGGLAQVFNMMMMLTMMMMMMIYI